MRAAKGQNTGWTKGQKQIFGKRGKLKSLGRGYRPALEDGVSVVRAMLFAAFGFRAFADGGHGLGHGGIVIGTATGFPQIGTVVIIIIAGLFGVGAGALLLLIRCSDYDVQMFASGFIVLGHFGVLTTRDVFPTLKRIIRQISSVGVTIQIFTAETRRRLRKDRESWGKGG